jgi:hypothetical protein
VATVSKCSGADAVLFKALGNELVMLHPSLRPNDDILSASDELEPFHIKQLLDTQTDVLLALPPIYKKNVV